MHEEILLWVETWEILRSNGGLSDKYILCQLRGMKEYPHRWEGDSWLAGSHAEWQLHSSSTPDLAAGPKGLCCSQVSGVQRQMWLDALCAPEVLVRASLHLCKWFLQKYVDAHNLTHLYWVTCQPGLYFEGIYRKGNVC